MPQLFFCSIENGLLRQIFCDVLLELLLFRMLGPFLKKHFVFCCGLCLQSRCIVERGKSKVKICLLGRSQSDRLI